MVTFTFPENLIQGFYLLEIYVSGFGVAGGSVVLESLLKINSVTPNTASQGGTEIVIAGSGFNPEGLVSVNIGNLVPSCKILSIN